MPVPELNTIQLPRNTPNSSHLGTAAHKDFLRVTYSTEFYLLAAYRRQNVQ